MSDGNVDLLHLAEASTFGELQHVHRVNPWVVRLAWFVAVALLLAAVTAFYLSSKLLATDTVASEFLTIGGAACVAASLALMTLTLWGCSLTYCVFRDAFVRVRGGRLTIVPWDEIEQVFEKPAAISSKIWITSNGRSSSISPVVNDYGALGETIVRKVSDRVLRRARPTLENGGVVRFGQLSITNESLICNNREITWGEVARFSVELDSDLAHLRVFADGQFNPWYSIPVHRIPNFRVLLDVVPHLCPAFHV